MWEDIIMKKIKIFLMLLFTFVLLIGFNVSVIAGEVYADHVAQLRELIITLTEQRQEYSTSYEHLSPLYIGTESDLLRELMDITIEAGTILDNTRGYSSGVPIVISGFAEPCYIRDTFLIGFSNERYLELLDLIIDFTGIPEEMIEIMVMGIISTDPTVGQPIDFDLPHTNEALPRNLSIPIGTRLMYWDAGSSRFILMGTLGHPRDSSGRTAFGTSHGWVPRGVNVFAASGAHNGRQLGIVANSVFDPAAGIDVSYIRFEFGTIQTSAAGMNITSFFGSTGSGFPQRQVTVIGSGGNLRGNLIGLSSTFDIDTPNGVRRHNNMISANMATQGGDSGAALIQDGGIVLGTLVAGNGVNLSIYSQAPRYQHVR